MDDLLIISCFFGKNSTKIYNAPNNTCSFFFTNNKLLEQDILDNQWNYVYVDKPLSDDIIISSLQSKYIKYLQFLKDYPQFINKKVIIYFDNKIDVKPEAIDEIKKLINDNGEKSLIIRQSPIKNKTIIRAGRKKIITQYKTSIYQEISEAMLQPRYAKNMDKTKQFFNELVKTGEISPNVRICITGLLIYINKDEIQALLDTVYNKCIEHEQPECQIYWNIFFQKYRNEILEIEYNHIQNIKTHVL